jgi:hypothetical protein
MVVALFYGEKLPVGITAFNKFIKKISDTGTNPFQCNRINIKE